MLVDSPYPAREPVLLHEKPKGPSTPTSNSFKVSRSDASGLTNDTLPSSVEDEIATAHDPTSSTLSITSSKKIHDIDPLHPEPETPTLLQSVTPTLPQTKSTRLLNSLLEDSLAVPQGPRRHTSPQPMDAAELTKPTLESAALFSGRRAPVARSTFPTYRAKLADVVPRVRNSTDSTDIQRVRNSIVLKRNMKKRRKEFLDDDKVLVGNKISEGHENFVMAYNMLTGIRVAVSRCSGIMKKLNDADFSSTKKLTFNMDGSEMTPSSKYDFKFKDYCPEVFRELRTIFGLDPADYLVSITGKYILSELGSPGKSGSFFYYSRDYRFIIKTIHHGEHKQLRRILKDYYNHVKENPNTLVSQFYGLHRVKMPFVNGGRKVHFIVMNNLFPPHRDIHLKYDLKGLTWGRITRITPDSDLSSLTLKDKNFLERNDSIKFGPHKRKLFFDQLDSDVKFLQKINVMDYSLLLGVHEVKKGNGLNIQQKLSVFDPKSTDKYALIMTNPRDIDRQVDLPNDVFPGRSKYVFYGHDGGIRATDEENVPLGEIYYLGIIDCLTNYSFLKRLETLWRSMSHPRSTISAVPAKEYGERFLKFIKKGTTSEKSKRS